MKIIINKMQIENQIIQFVSTEMEKLIHLDKIGKCLLSKTTILKANSKKL